MATPKDPSKVRKNIIQEEDVRRFVGDMEAHDLLGGFAFSPDDIRQAMQLAVAEFNELPPSLDGNQIFYVDNIPFMNMFLEGIASKLYRAKIHQLSHELLNYQVGSVQYTDKETRMKAYTAMEKDANARFREEALSLKRRMNLENGYDSVLSPYSWWFRIFIISCGLAYSSAVC